MKVIKKADIYFEGDKKEIRVSIEFPELANFHDCMAQISDIIQQQQSDCIKVRSIYFSEEKTISSKDLLIKRIP